MKKIFILLWVVIALLLFSCSSSNSSNDSDILPDADEDTQDSEIQDDDSDSQGSEIVDDSDETPKTDSDSDTEEDFDYEDDNDEEYREDFDLTNCCEDYHKEFPDEPLFDEPPSIFDRYKRCYDEIPDDPYEGLFASSKLESQIKQSLGYDDDYELKEEDLEKIKEITLSVKDIRGVEKLINLEYAKFNDRGGGGNIYDFTPLSNLKKLKKINIRFRPPEQISPDEHVVNMTCLDGSFSLLTTLETLEIQNTHLKEVNPIEQLVNWYFSLILGFIKNGDKWRRLLEKVGVLGVGFGENKISKYWVFRPVFGIGHRGFLKFLKNS